MHDLVYQTWWDNMHKQEKRPASAGRYKFTGREWRWQADSFHQK